MSVITIQCRLIASGDTREQIWNLMAQRNTPLVNELLWLVTQEKDFLVWCQTGRLPFDLIQKLCTPLKTDNRFQPQPERFYRSAIAHVEQIYKSYFAVQKKLYFRLQKQERWLRMLATDQELEADTQSSLDGICSKAKEILETYKDSENLTQSLFDAYDQSSDTLTKGAICFLIKNGCRIPEEREDGKKFAQRRRKVEIKIERLKKQIDSNTPKGRDLTKIKWLETLTNLNHTASDSIEQIELWQKQLLTNSTSVPYPLRFNSNEDLKWSKNSQGRLCVKFNGLAKHSFEIYCDQRQLEKFERFYEDQEVKKNSNNEHTTALFTLRSGILAWQENPGKQEPWVKNRLTLFCSFDTRFWTAEGTEQVRKEKAEKVTRTLVRMTEKEEITKNQDASIKRNQTILNRLNNPFPRPSKFLYQGCPEIVVAVAMILETPATVAIVNTVTGKVLTYRSIKQLLGDNYRLLNRQRKQKQKLAHQRHKVQHKSSSVIPKHSESNLGEYLDRIIAKEIVLLAQKYRAFSIVVPKLNNIRESIHAEIKGKAEAKIPGCLKAQKNYLKNYRTNFHQWSYKRLIDNITVQSSKLGIIIEEVKQSNKGHPQDTAYQMALLAYKSRFVP